METIGFVSIDGLKGGAKKETDEITGTAAMTFSRRYIDGNLLGYYHHTGLNESTFPTEHGKNVSLYIQKARKELSLDHTFGCAPQDLWLNRADYPSNNSILTWLEEQVLPDQVQGEDRADIPRIAIINTGSMRFDIFKGAFTKDTTFIVSPFNSRFKYIKDVPYKVAKRVLPLINQGGPVFGAADPQEFLVAPEQLAIQKLIASSEDRKVFAEAQHPLLLGSQKPSLIPGYTTKDDGGHDGDDTIHAPIKFYNVPNCIESEIGFPEETDPETVDLVFLDFIQPWVMLALAFSGGSYGNSDVLPYIGDKTFTELIASWVHEHWDGEC
jgi:hypothetical protein